MTNILKGGRGGYPVEMVSWSHCGFLEKECPEWETTLEFGTPPSKNIVCVNLITTSDDLNTYSDFRSISYIILSNRTGYVNRYAFAVRKGVMVVAC